MLYAPLLLLLLCFAFVEGGKRIAPPLIDRTSSIVVRNCTDKVSCRAESCRTTRYTAGDCVYLGPDNALIAAPFVRFACLTQPSLCTPTQVFVNDPSCTKPIETFWAPCGTCLQSPPRDAQCAVVNDTYYARVGSCGTDATCGTCSPDKGAGMPQGVCWPHPGVPGLYLKFPTLEACAVIEAHGYNTSDCSGDPDAWMLLPSQNRCYMGFSFDCAV